MCNLEYVEGHYPEMYATVESSCAGSSGARTGLGGEGAVVGDGGGGGGGLVQLVARVHERARMAALPLPQPLDLPLG